MMSCDPQKRDRALQMLRSVLLLVSDPGTEKLPSLVQKKETVRSCNHLHQHQLLEKTFESSGHNFESPGEFLFIYLFLNLIN